MSKRSKNNHNATLNSFSDHENLGHNAALSGKLQLTKIARNEREPTVICPFARLVVRA